MTASWPDAVRAHLDATVEAAARWQLQDGVDAGGLACPVARVPLQWPEFSLLPVVVDAAARASGRHRALAHGLVAYLARVQRPDGTFDAGFCGDLFQPCNAAFALRPLARALASWHDGLGADAGETLRGVLQRAARAAADGGMTTVNHRWVAAGGLAHAARALGDDAFARAADDWTRTEIDQREDGSFSEGSPNYALVSADAFLDLEALQGRGDLGERARRCVAWLRELVWEDGSFVTIGSSRWDTDGSSDCWARAASVFERCGERALARRMLGKLWSARTAPGVLSPVAHPPLGGPAKAKLYPSMVSALAAESLLRWLDGAAGATPDRDGGGAWEQGEGSRALAPSGLLVHRSGGFGLAAGRGPNLLEARAAGPGGAAVLEAARLLVHAVGWNPLFVTGEKIADSELVLELSSAPGHDFARLPQFHRTRPGERTPGNPVPATRGRWRVEAGPGPRARVELELDGAPGAHALLELGARPDQTWFDAEGRRLEAPVAAGPAGVFVLAGSGAARLVLRHRGGSAHALQVQRYGYGDGDALWAPSYAPRTLRLGLRLPARLELSIEADGPPAAAR